jgi:hypothetical protein
LVCIHKLGLVVMYLLNWLYSRAYEQTET